MKVFLYDYSSNQASMFHARRLTESEQAKEPAWTRDIAVKSIPGTWVDLPKLDYTDAPKRELDCSLGRWKGTTISDQEWEAYIALNAEREAEAKKAELARQVESAKKVIDACERQGQLYTKEEAQRMATQYNEMNNDGGWGFVPHFYTKDEYAEAKSILDQYA